MTSREPGATEDGATPVLGAGSRRSVPAAALRRGDGVGRYVILDWVGQGGMGVVYAGYDPELDRRVAIKLVRPDRDAADGPAGLLREARAMARVRHPGVIAIHDIGVVDEQVFLAMEFIDGGTLAAWLRAAPRRWSEVLAMFVQAGRGLAQAHRVGVLHRDFKPESGLASQVVENTSVPRLRRWYVPIMYQAKRPRQDRAARVCGERLASPRRASGVASSTPWGTTRRTSTF